MSEVMNVGVMNVGQSKKTTMYVSVLKRVSGGILSFLLFVR